jgi:hypothetical protein
MLDVMRKIMVTIPPAVFPTLVMQYLGIVIEADT